jgi:hypothetical protein
MTQAQAIGVIALTEQNTVLARGGTTPLHPPGMEGFYYPRGDDPPATPRYGGALPLHSLPTGGRRQERAPLRPPALWLRLRPCGCCEQALHSPQRLGAG